MGNPIHEELSEIERRLIEAIVRAEFPHEQRKTVEVTRFPNIYGAFAINGESERVE